MNLVINESQPLWEYLRCAEKPVVLYGMGDGALEDPGCVPAVWHSRCRHLCQR
ncbi:MAG: hypothetical protein V8Q30_00945 [Acutalibacteraceae bacterium]